MASGSRSAIRPEKSPAGAGFRRAAAALALTSLAAAAAALALTLMMRGPSFEAALRSIDYSLESSPYTAPDSAFASAYRNAAGPGDWLSVIKRARIAEAAGDRGRYVQAATLAIRRQPRSEPVAAAAAHAFLRGGLPERALALFRPASGKGKAAPLSPEGRPGLWAEAFVEAGSPAGAAIRDYARLASIVGEGTPYLGASALSAAEGDLAGARYWLVKAMEEGAAAPTDLMWDCGLYEELSARTDLLAGSAELATMGDAAWQAGDRGLARARWERAIALDPRRSWKPYASLALASGTRTESSESYWNRLRAAFLSGPGGAARDGALLAYAAELARKGRDSEALKLLDRGEATEAGKGALLVLEAAIRAKSEPEGRIAADFARLAEARPEDRVVAGARLRLLAERGFAAELVQAYEAAERKGFRPDNGWFYGAWVLAARGKTAEAADLLAREGSDAAGPAAAFALGTLKSALGRYSEAAELFERAAAASSGGTERAAALKHKGRALKASGDSIGATAAFKAAAVADPEDAEAAVLARSASLR
jgi:tetratricopeptide (TPR) repeat protein